MPRQDSVGEVERARAAWLWFGVQDLRAQGFRVKVLGFWAEASVLGCSERILA